MPKAAQDVKPAVGTPYWLPLAIFLFAIVVIVPILWLLIALWVGVPLNLTGDLLPTISGVMGTIFTVGGLVIALVSVYTQLSIEDRIKRSFDVLQPELDARANTQIEAHLAFLRARDQGNWREAQQLAEEALTKWPTLRGVRAFLAQKNECRHC